MGEAVVNSEEVMAVDVGAEEITKQTDKKEEEEEVEEENYGSKEEVKWESYLPRMVLRVLLVEADDSTRHIVTALLRKCGYRGNYSLPFIYIYIYIFCFYYHGLILD